MNRITEYTTNLLTLSHKLGGVNLNNSIDTTLRPTSKRKCHLSTLLPSLNWRQGFFIALIALPLAFGSCGKTRMYFPELEEFYEESMELKSVSTDSIARFSAKVENFVVLYPEAKDDPLYPAIQKNIKSANAGFKITINPDWGEDINFNF